MESSQYCRLPVGVTNGVSCFQRIIDSVFADDELKQTFAYLDNINISGFDKADHDHNLKMFLDSASKINLTFNDAKFLVAVAEVDVLGYRISQGSIRPDPEHLRLLIELPMHKSSKELKRCLGMFAYYARWIRHFSGKMKPLIAGKVHIPLQSDAVAAFESLLEELLSACLKCIGENEPFTVHCDASDFAIVAVLSQGERPVAFMSRTLSKSECNNHTVEKNVASIDAVRKWGHYLYSRPFTQITDQRSCLTNVIVVN